MSATKARNFHYNMLNFKQLTPYSFVFNNSIYSVLMGCFIGFKHGSAFAQITIKQLERERSAGFSNLIGGSNFPWISLISLFFKK